MSYVNSNGYIQEPMVNVKQCAVGTSYEITRDGGAAKPITLNHLQNGYVHLLAAQVDDIMLPSAAQIISKIGGKVGSYVDLLISNGAAAASNLIVYTGDGANNTLVGTVAVPASKNCKVRFIVVSASAIRTVISQSA